jgi:hypothetical protein
MADDEIRRTARPTGGPNAANLTKAQNRYKTFDRAANTEYERLMAIDAKKKLTPSQYPAEHAIFFHLCNLQEGVNFESYVFSRMLSYLFNFLNGRTSRRKGESESGGRCQTQKCSRQRKTCAPFILFSPFIVYAE